MSSICINCQNPSQDPIICEWCQTKINFDWDNINNYIFNQSESVNNKKTLFGCDIILQYMDGDELMLFHSNTFKNFFDGTTWYNSYAIGPIYRQHEDGIVLEILVYSFPVNVIDYAIFEMTPIKINSGIELLDAIKQIIEALSVSQETFDKKYNVKYKNR